MFQHILGLIADAFVAQDKTVGSLTFEYIINSYIVGAISLHEYTLLMNAFNSKNIPRYGGVS